MATILDDNFRTPTPEQSQYVKYFNKIFPDEHLLRLKPGYLAGVPNVFKLLELHIYMVTSADVGNRVLIPSIGRSHSEGGSGSVVFRATTGNIAASQAARVVLGQYDINSFSGLTLDFQADVEAYAQLPNMILSGGDSITIVDGGTFAADYYEIKVFLEYLNNKERIKGTE